MIDAVGHSRTLSHIPSDYAVNGGAAAGESGSHRDDQFRSCGWTRFRRQRS